MTWDLVLIGLTIALSPLPIIAFILVTASRRGAVRGLAFIVGWVVTLSAVIASTLVLTGGKPPRPQTLPGTAVLVADIVLGLALIVYAGVTRRKMRSSPGASPSPPKWLERIDDLSLVGVALLAFLLQPWPLVAAGAASVSEMSLPSAASVVTLVAYALLGSSALLAMETYLVGWHRQATSRLRGVETWLIEHRRRILVVIAGVVGSYLVLKGIVRLV